MILYSICVISFRIPLSPKRKEAKTKLNRRGRHDVEENDDEPEIILKIPPPPKLEDEVVDIPKEEVPM